MDGNNFLSNISFDAKSVFSANQTISDNDEDCSTLFKMLENTLEKQVKTWWDVFTFEHYLRQNLIFRSIRWEVAPQDSLTNKTFMDEWLEFFNNAR